MSNYLSWETRSHRSQPPREVPICCLVERTCWTTLSPTAECVRLKLPSLRARPFHRKQWWHHTVGQIWLIHVVYLV